MKTTVLGKTNRKVSTISLGTWAHGGPNESNGQGIGWTGHDDGLALKALIGAWEAGINHWDTADVYGNGHSEELIGQTWDTVPRDDIFLASKVGWDKGEFNNFYHPELMRSHLERSLKNMRVEQLDLYYFHHCLFGKKNSLLDDAMETMLRFKDEGKILHIGLSDWDMSKIVSVVDRINPDVIQPYRNVKDDYYHGSGLKKWVDDNNAGVVFFSTLRHGLLTGKYSEPPKFEAGDFRSGVAEFGDAAFIKRMQDNRQKMEERFAGHPNAVLHGLTGALLTDAPTGCVILGQRNPRQVAAAATLGDTLSQADADWVFSLYK